MCIMLLDAIAIYVLLSSYKGLSKGIINNYRSIMIVRKLYDCYIIGAR